MLVLSQEQHDVARHEAFRMLEVSLRGEDCVLLLSVSRIYACTRSAKLNHARRECQIADWKKGVPVPHKQFCGQPLDEGSLDHVEKPAQNADWMKPFGDNLAKYNLSEGEMNEVSKQLADMFFPEPAPGFKRSIALQLQIKILRENFDAHYMVDSTPLDPLTVA